TTKQALSFQNPFYLKKAQQLEPKLHDGNIIKNNSAIVIPDSEETLMLAEKSRSRMILKQQDLMMLEKKVNTTPVDYAALNQLSQDFETRFVPQIELSAEQAFWSQNSMNSSDPNPSCRPTKVEVPKELPKVSMVNTSLKKLKQHLASFDVVVKERTTATTITEGLWGFKRTKAFFRDEIIPFVKALKDLFNTFDQYLIDKLSEVQNVFHLMEQIKKDLEEIETINIELDHRVSKLIAENEHLKQTYKQLYDSIKLARIRSKEQCDDLINQVNLKSVEISDLNASLQEKVLEITALKDDLRKLKGKALVDNAVTKHTIDPKMLKIDVEPITPKLLNKKTAHSAYIKHTQEEATVLKDLVEHVKSKYPLDHSLESACSAPSFDQYFELNELKAQSQEKDTVIKKLKERIKSLSENMNENEIKKDIEEIETINIELDHREKDVVITTLKNELRKLKGKDLADNVVTKHPIAPEMLKIDVEPIAPGLLNNRITHSNYLRHTQEQAAILREICNGCMLSDNHDLYVLDFINDVNARNKSKSVKKSSKRKVWKLTGKVFTNIRYTWRPTGRTFTIVGNTCPLTRITTTAEVTLRKPTALESDTPKPVVTLVYSRKPKKSKTNVPVSKPKNIKSLSANKKEPNNSWGSIVSDVPSSSLDECRSSKLFSGTVKLKNDHVAKILGYGDYQIGNVTISRVYYVEGLGHNLFSVG
ncbi:hypothetical protein Tco_1020895, partial [Tanacetum coccineum]